MSRGCVGDGGSQSCLDSISKYTLKLHAYEEDVLCGYRVHNVKRDNLTISCLTKNVGCQLCEWPRMSTVTLLLKPTEGLFLWNQQSNIHFLRDSDHPCIPYNNGVHTSHSSDLTRSTDKIKNKKVVS